MCISNHSLGKPAHSEDDLQQIVWEDMMSKDTSRLLTLPPSPATERFRVLLRERFMQMNDAAARNGASREYLDTLARNTEKILQATQRDQARKDSNLVQAW